MEDERIPKKVLNGKFHNTRPVGNPRTRWEGIIQRGTSQILGIRGWRIQAEHRDEWKCLSEGGQAQRAQQHHRVMEGWDAMLCHGASGSKLFERTQTATQYHISKHRNCMQHHHRNLVPCKQTVRCNTIHDTAISETIRHIKNLFHLELHIHSIPQLYYISNNNNHLIDFFTSTRGI
jgi:hypothetical protein